RIVTGRNGLPPRIVPGEVPKLHIENRGLNRVEPRIYTDAGADKALPPAIFANFAQSRGDSGVVRNGHASIARRTQVLGRIEAETPNVANRARGPPAIGRSMALRAILDETQAMRTGDVNECAEFGGLAIEVHGQYRCRPPRERHL